MDQNSMYIQSNMEDGAVEDGVVDRGVQIISKTMELPEFTGDWTDPDNFLDWIEEVEHVFDTADIGYPMRVRLVIASFSGYALMWWNNLQLQHEREGGRMITCWMDLMLALHKRFIPVSYTKDTYMKLLGFKQTEGMSVREYTEAFEKLCYRADIKDNDEQKMCRYISGLRETIKFDVLIKDVWNLNDAIHIACKSERLQNPSMEADQHDGEYYTGADEE